MSAVDRIREELNIPDPRPTIRDALVRRAEEADR